MHVRMSAMEDIGHVIILAIISCQVIVRVHAAIIMQALPLYLHALLKTVHGNTPTKLCCNRQPNSAVADNRNSRVFVPTNTCGC